LRTLELARSVKKKRRARADAEELYIMNTVVSITIHCEYRQLGDNEEARLGSSFCGKTFCAE
jgi:hypothetical protein